MGKLKLFFNDGKSPAVFSDMILVKSNNENITLAKYLLDGTVALIIAMTDVFEMKGSSRGEFIIIEDYYYSKYFDRQSIKMYTIN